MDKGVEHSQDVSLGISYKTVVNWVYI